MDRNFEYLVKKAGRPAKAEPFLPEEATRLRGKLPDGLLAMWTECGIGSWGHGRFQFCRPDRYGGVVTELLREDPEFSPEWTHVVGFSAFGTLLLWHEQWQVMQVDLVYLRARASKYRDGWTPSAPDVAIVSALTTAARRDAFELYEDAPGTPPMFERCAERYGELELGECYGLFPALALGGAAHIANIRRVSALEHFAILAGLGRTTLMRYEGTRAIAVRELGP